MGYFYVDAIGKLIFFGVDGVNVFQGVCNSVTYQIQNRFVPHLEGIP
jgi:hypothetical protein